MIKRILKTKNKLNNSALIHCITNPISINDCANAVLSLGAKPIMAEHPEEVSEITKTSKSLAVNLGNITDARIKSIMISGKTAYENNIPVIIDIVGVSCSKLRLDFANEFIKTCKPHIIKGNISEIKTLLGLSSDSVGVDASSRDKINDELLESLSSYSKEHKTVMLTTGKKDLIVFENKAYMILNGVDMLSKITGTGCMLTTMIATYMSTGDLLESTILATATLTIAGELSKNAKGTGSFRISLMDYISTLDEKTILDKIQIEEFTL